MPRRLLLMVQKLFLRGTFSLVSRTQHFERSAVDGDGCAVREIHLLCMDDNFRAKSTFICTYTVAVWHFSYIHS